MREWRSVIDKVLEDDLKCCLGFEDHLNRAFHKLSGLAHCLPLNLPFITVFALYTKYTELNCFQLFMQADLWQKRGKLLVPVGFLDESH